MSLNKSDVQDEEEELFDWDDYLKRTNSEAAPPNCFSQHLIPPTNEFKVGNKLETTDPRNTTSTCISTIIEISGPRLRLRLDGTDDRNDFWLMCDSDLLHPFEYTAKQGNKLRPPLGYGNDLSKWPKFLEKLIQTAGDVFAPESCFKSPPVKRQKNEFKVGQKLEAVDPKNPHLICPATIKEIKRDKLCISFDGWSHSSQFWTSFTSRDLFPCGWCEKAGHVLQPPGDLEEKSQQTPVLQSNVVKTPVTTTPAIKNTTKAKSKANKSSNKANNLSASASGSDNSSNNLDVTNEGLTDNKNDIKMSTILEKPSNHEPIKFDLSIVKSEMFDPSEIENESCNQTAAANNGTNGSKKNANIRKTNVIVYVNPKADCGPLIKTQKFHTSHTKFGPGLPSIIYKSIIQSFVDCAINRYEVFKFIPEGNSNDFVKLKTQNLNQKKRLIQIETPQDMWSNLKLFCELISVDDKQLLTSKSVFNNSTNKLITQNEIKPTQMSSTPLTPQPSSSSSASSTTSNENTQLVNSIENSARVNGHKRPSTSSTSTNNHNINQADNDDNNEDTNTNHSNAKILKLDATLSCAPITEWSIDQVVYYINQLCDNYFSSFIDIFRHHEIDGKALLLLNTEILMKYMGFKLGPALKLNNYLDKLRRSVVATNQMNGTSGGDQQ